MSDDRNPLQPAAGEDLPASIAPIEAIMEEAAKFEKMPDQAGILEGRPLNDVIDESLTKPRPKTHCRGLIVEGENTVVFASSNVGKSVACYQMAEQICFDTGEVVDYLDFELSDMHLLDRYTDAETGARHYFPRNLHRYEIKPDLITEGNVEEAILASIEKLAQDGDRFFFVDNLTFICRDSEKGLGATEFMMRLIKLRRTYNLTIVVIAHTPKRDGKQPITQYDLAGSSKLISFFDAGIAIGRSAKDKETRYIKQVKVRTGAELYGSDNVLVYRLIQTDGYTHFEFEDFGREQDHLKENNSFTEMEDIKEIIELVAKKMSVREIARETGMTASTVHRRIKKAKKIGLLTQDGQPVSPVPSAEQVEQTEQPETPAQPEQQNLFEEEDSDE